MTCKSQMSFTHSIWRIFQTRSCQTHFCPAELSWRQQQVWLAGVCVCACVWGAGCQIGADAKPLGAQLPSLPCPHFSPPLFTLTLCLSVCASCFSYLICGFISPQNYRGKVQIYNLCINGTSPLSSTFGLNYIYFIVAAVFLDELPLNHSDCNRFSWQRYKPQKANSRLSFSGMNYEYFRSIVNCNEFHCE